MQMKAKEAHTQTHRRSSQRLYFTASLWISTPFHSSDINLLKSSEVYMRHKYKP